MMEEIWKPVKGFEDFYEVSNFGRVRSLDRVIVKPHPRNTSMTLRYIMKGRILKQKRHPAGYWSVELYTDTFHQTKTVHRMVAESFIPNPNNLPEVNHIDEDKSNSLVTNLEWVTKSGNMQHGTCGERMGKKHWKAVVQMDLQGNDIKVWDCAQHASKELNINHPQIIAVCRCKKNYKTAGGYRWRYKE